MYALTNVIEASLYPNKKKVPLAPEEPLLSLDNIDFEAPDVSSNMSFEPQEPTYAVKWDAKSEPYRKLIEQLEAEHELPKGMLPNLIGIESSWNPKAVSPVGAGGLMQLMPETAKELGVKDVFDPKQNIKGGVKYLKQLKKRFGTWPKAWTAYNMGPTALAEDRPIPDETAAYVEKMRGFQVSSPDTGVSGTPDTGINFESDEPIKFSLDEGESQQESIYEGFIKPTFKSVGKVGAALGTSLALLPGAGVAGGLKLLPKISTDPDKFMEWGSLDEAMKTYNQVMSIPSEFLTTPEDRKAMENISLAMKPFEMAGEGWRLIGHAINEGLRDLGLPADTYLEPLLATYGEAAALFAMPEVVKKVGNSTWYRMRTIPERGLVVQSLAETLEKNPKMTEGELLRTYDNPAWRDEALKARSVVDSYAEVKEVVKQKASEAKLATEPENPLEITRPTEATPSHTFTSKRGYYYEQIGGKWYDSKGVEVTHKFVLRAAEAKKVRFEEDVEVAAEEVARDIEEKTGKRIEEVTDEEIDKYYEEKEGEVIQLRKTVPEGKPKFKPGDRIIAVSPEINGVATRGVMDNTFAELDAVGPTKTLFDWNRSFPKIKEMVENKYGKEGLDTILGYTKQLESHYREAGEKDTHGVSFIESLQHYKDQQPGGRLYEESVGKPFEVIKGGKPKSKSIIEKKISGLFDDLKTGTGAKSKYDKVGEAWEVEPVAEEPVVKAETKASKFLKTDVEIKRDTKLFDEKQKSVKSDPDMLTQKLINDVNRWIKGDKEIDIDRTVNTLKMMRDKADYLRPGEVREAFDNSKDWLVWKESVTKAAEWADGLDRLKIEQTYVRVGEVDFDKPQGLYLAKEGSELVSDLEGKTTKMNIQPKNPLNVNPSMTIKHARGKGFTIEASSGIKALKKLVGDKEFERLRTASKADLINELSNKYPDVDWDRFYDSYEMLEGYAGKLAREKGYDAIIGDIDEVVVLDKSAIDRSKFEPSDGIKLNMMIPLDEIPKAVRGLWNKVKESKIPLSKLFRNKKVWKETGYWLGQDGKWRYELDDTQINFFPGRLYESTKRKMQLGNILEYPDLFEKFPEAKAINVRVDSSLGKGKGHFNPSNNEIVMGFAERDTLLHEIQHWVNNRVGSEFLGTDIKAQENKLLSNMLLQIKKSVTDPEVLKEVNKTIRINDQLYTKLSPHAATQDMEIIAFRKNKNDYEAIKNALEEYFIKRPTEEYQKDPGEMEARLVEERMLMSAKERKKTPPWQTLEDMLFDEGLVKDNYLDYSSETGTKLYSGFGPLDSAAKKIFEKAKRLLRPTPRPPEPFSIKSQAKEIVLERRANLDLANYDTNKFINSIEQRLDLTQREAMPFVIEGTEVPEVLGRPDLSKVIEKDGELLKGIAGEVKQHFNEGWLKIKKHIPNLSVKQIEDYVTHLWDVPRHKRAEAVSWFQTQNRFLERRFIDTYKEGIEKGFKPKVLDISEIIRIHDAVSNRSIENIKYVKAILALKDQGIHLIQRTGTAPLEWIEVDYPALTRRIPLPKRIAGKSGEFVKELKVRVHPDLVRPLRAVFEQRFDHPVISAYEALNGILKKSMLSVSLFHHGALGETGVALMGPGKTGKIMFDPVKIYNAIAKGEYDIFTKEAIARDSIAHGVQYGATADIPVSKIQGYLDTLAKKTENTLMLNRLTKGMKGFNSVWDKALWNYLHDTLKLYGYESLVSKLDPNMGPEATKMAKREIGQLINDTFGGQNWDTLMMTPKEVQMLTWSLLSADWTFSTTRQALAPTGIGAVYKESAKIRKKMGRRFWFRAALYFGIGINGLNVMFRKQDMKENPQYYRDKDYTLLDKTMLGNTVGKKTKLFVGRYKDGSERYLKWGKQFQDFYELLASPLQKLGGKIAPIPQMLSEIFTGHTLSGFKNDDVYGKKGLNYTLGVLKTVAKAPVPLALRRLMKDNIEFKPSDIFMPSSKGMTRYRALEYFKTAIVDQDIDLLRETYEGALKNNLPAFTLFNGALSWTENEIMSEVSKSVADIRDAESKLNMASSAYDKRRYGIILRRLHKEKADKEAGWRLFKSAVEKSKVYSDLGGGSAPRLPRR